MEAQTKRSQPDARAPELFILLHGMMFTNIQLDDFQGTLSRFVERLAIEGAEEREWIMMATINIGAILEYGKVNGVLKRLGGVSGVKVMKKADPKEDRMQVDPDYAMRPDLSPAPSDAEQDGPEHPVAFTLALQLAFVMFSHVLHHPTRKASQFSRSNINPYLTVLFTFLSTVLRHPPTLAALERHIPWQDLTHFLPSVPRSIMAAQGLQTTQSGERWIMLTSNAAPPLPEDWCLRGMEWIGRKVYERGFWRVAEERKPELQRRPELEVLDTHDRGELTDGTIEDDDEDEEDSYLKSDLGRRWVRLIRSGVTFSHLVPGFHWVQATRQWRIEGDLEQKVQQWQAEDLEKKREEETRHLKHRMTEESDDMMDVDAVAGAEEDEDSSDNDDENDSEQVKELKVSLTLPKSHARSHLHRRPVDGISRICCNQVTRNYARSLDEHERAEDPPQIIKHCQFSLGTPCSSLTQISSSPCCQCSPHSSRA